MYSRPLFTLRRTGMERGDCTAPYKIDFLGILHPTFKEFVKYLLENGKEWGDVYITPNPDCTTVWSIMSLPKETLIKISYRYEHILNAEEYAKILEKYGDRRIKYATADGGWSKMDYVLLLESDDNMKYKEFGDVDIPTDFEKSLKNVRHAVECLYEDRGLTISEYNTITTALDGAEARYYGRSNI